MNGKTYLAFDLGASSGRAILGRKENGKLILDEVHRFVNYPYEKNGHWFWDFNKIISEIKTGIKKACDKTTDIETLSVDTWGVDYAFFRNGKLLRDPYNYRDTRTAQAYKEIHSSIMSECDLYKTSGIQLMELNTIYQLYDHKTRHAEDFEGGSVCLLIPDAILYILTGEISSEYTDASTTSLLDPHSRNWNYPLMEKLGIPSNVFTRIVMPGTDCGYLKKEIADELAVPQIHCVKTTSHDTASAVAAVPATDENEKFAYMSLGTWAVPGGELDTPVITPAAWENNYSNEGGYAGKIRFLTNVIGTWLMQETRRVWNAEGRNISFQEMSQMARGTESKFSFDAGDKIFITPGDIPARIREWCRNDGQGEITSDAELLRTIYNTLAESFAAEIRNLEAVTGVKFKSLNVIGGGSKDSFLLELTEKALGIKVNAGPVEATATGNLLVQMIASGEIENLNEARKLSAASL